jgi:hypothetical protein
MPPITIRAKPIFLKFGNKIIEIDPTMDMINPILK